MNIESKKKFAASLSILSNGLIIVLKLIAGIISGSISIISEAVHSTSDFLASVLTYFAVLRSSQPADKEHPFGHGGYEDVAGFLEGLLIIIASFYIISEAVKKIVSTTSSGFDSTLGIIVMGFAIISNICVSRYLLKVSKESDSVALKADSKHLGTDVYSSLGVLIGLVLIKITGLTLLDPIIALIVAVIILKSGIKITREALNNLVDGRLPDVDVKKIEQIMENCEKIYGYKNLKSRKSGPNRDIDITILCDGSMPLKYCHEICDELEFKVKKVLPNTLITIHCEPFNK